MAISPKKRTEFPADANTLPVSEFGMKNSFEASSYQDVGGAVHVKGLVHDRTTAGKYRPYPFEGRYSSDGKVKADISAADPENTNSFDARDDKPTPRAISGFAPGTRSDLRSRASAIVEHIGLSYANDMAFIAAQFDACTERVEHWADDGKGRSKEVRRSGGWLLTRDKYPRATLYTAKRA